MGHDVNGKIDFLRPGAVLRALALLACMSAAGQGMAVPPEMPWNMPAEHIGVATCAGSNCHGSAQPFDDSPVLQNEYFTWQRKDAHSNAYKLLLTPESKRMAANLGIAKAEQASECLTCHSDYVPESKRGRRYSLSEGVGCEACHGGAENYLGPHVTGNTHQENIADGLYPLADPVDRARLCLNCHMGSADKPIDHRIMGAGHPPLEFELDTFTNIQPPHFRVDADYKKRKPYAPPAKTWAIGQLIASEQFLAGLRSERLKAEGMFPELVFYDCNACHHPMRPPRWNKGAGGPLGPGTIRLADAYLVMSGHVISALAPALETSWQSALNAMHFASQRSVGAIQSEAATLAGLVDQALDQLRTQPISDSQALDLMRRIAESGIARDAADFTAAKQMFYGLEALLAQISASNQALAERLNPPMDTLFKALDAQASYDPQQMRSGLKQVQQVLARQAG
ncbi:MAG: multiheme c-type cytochrome [Algiphilus sp.]